MICARLLVSVGLCSLVAGGFADARNGWKTLAPKNSGFSVQMPGTPQVVSQTVKDEGISYPVHRYAVSKEGVLYQVTYATIPIKLAPNQVDALLENVIHGMSKASGMPILKDDPSNVQGTPARIFALGNPNSVIEAGMTCWDGHRSYILTLKGFIGDMRPGLIRDFGKTFKLIASK